MAGKERLEKALQWVFNEIYVDPNERVAAAWMRNGVKVFLELLRNLAVIAAFQYFAQKTESRLLWALTFAGYGALWFYCTSFLQIWLFRFTFIKRRWLNATVSLLSHLIVVGGIAYGSFVLIQRTIAEIARAQGIAAPTETPARKSDLSSCVPRD